MGLYYEMQPHEKTSGKADLPTDEITKPGKVLMPPGENARSGKALMPTDRINLSGKACMPTDSNEQPLKENMLTGLEIEKSIFSSVKGSNLTQKPESSVYSPIISFADAGYMSDQAKAKSQTGYCFLINGATIS